MKAEFPVIEYGTLKGTFALKLKKKKKAYVIFSDCIISVDECQIIYSKASLLHTFSSPSEFLTSSTPDFQVMLI